MVVIVIGRMRIASVWTFTSRRVAAWSSWLISIENRFWSLLLAPCQSECTFRVSSDWTHQRQSDGVALYKNDNAALSLVYIVFENQRVVFYAVNLAPMRPVWIELCHFTSACFPWRFTLSSFVRGVGRWPKYSFNKVCQHWKLQA